MVLSEFLSVVLFLNFLFSVLLFLREVLRNYYLFMEHLLGLSFCSATFFLL